MDTFATMDTSPASSEPEERLVLMTEVLRLTGLSRTILYERMGHGEFPKPRKVGAKNAWLYSEIRAWMQKLPKGAL
jgi:predicted DNA-binding transcriptional regulator AlpA